MSRQDKVDPQMRQRLELEAFDALIERRLHGHDFYAVPSVARQLMSELVDSAAATLTETCADGVRKSATLTMHGATVKGVEITDLSMLRNWQSAARDKIAQMRLGTMRKAGL